MPQTISYDGEHFSSWCSVQRVKHLSQEQTLSVFGEMLAH